MFVVEDFAADVGEAEFSVIIPPHKPAADDDGAMEPPVIRLVNACLFGALEDGAGDVHFEPGANQLRVRYRIDGRLVERMSPPPRMRHAVAARLRMLAGLEPAARRLPQEGSIAAQFRGRPVAFRANFMPGRHGQTVVLHVAEEERGPIRLEKLGFGYETLKQWRKLISRPNGLILVTGPSGSGKRDTLYSSIQDRPNAEMNICTVEDPVEQTLSGVNQFEVDEKNGLTFPSALRALLRQEPDVLMVSWMRDGETARLAAQAAMTGRLVIGALHANDAPTTITRLMALGVEPYVVGATVLGVLAQRQVRRLCPACKEPYQPASGEKRQIERFTGPCETLYRARGCDRCHRLGYYGRIGIHELLICEDAIAERISQGIGIAELRDLAAKSGMKTLRVDGLEKVKSGITTLDEVYRVTV
jgi:type II secretory ATPase GspE/PulE/Tfp pilus assembly ATPase PilB-like protein